MTAGATSGRSGMDGAIPVNDAVIGWRMTRCCRSRFGSRRGLCIGAGFRPVGRGRFSRVFSWAGPWRRIICGPWTGRGQGFRGGLDSRPVEGRARPRSGLKSLFQKSPLKNRAVHCATIYDISPSITTVYVPKSRHSRENGNLEAGVPVGFELMKQALETRPYIGVLGAFRRDRRGRVRVFRRFVCFGGANADAVQVLTGPVIGRHCVVFVGGRITVLLWEAGGRTIDEAALRFLILLRSVRPFAS